MRIEGQVAVITGGASGMGQACAKSLAEKGAKVIVWDIHSASSNRDWVECDVSSAESVELAITTTLHKIGVPTLCINCAGIAPAQRITGKQGLMPLSAFQKVIDVNLTGTFNVMRVIADTMIKYIEADDGEERGIIINTASIAAYEGQIGQTAYSASKGGIVSMTLPAARELAQFGIRVNTIAPGLISTPLFANFSKEVKANLANNVTFPKRLGQPEEFAALAIHLIENSYINGEVIRLDGGLRMQAR